MVAYVLALLALLFLIALFSAIFYALQDINLDELRTRARRGGANSKRLYALVARGHEVPAALALYGAFCFAALAVAIASRLPWYTALLLLASLLFLFGFAVPQLWLRKRAARWAAILAVPLQQLLLVASPLTGPLGRAIKRKFQKKQETISRDALIEMLRSHRVTADTEEQKNELNVIGHVIEFGDIVIGEIMTPKKDVVFVKSDDMLLPAFLQELHNSGFSRFPVVSPNDDTHIVGTIFLRDAVKVTEPTEARNIMDGQVNYLNMNATLGHALNAVVRTGRSLFIVINKDEDMVGVVTIEDILRKLFGREFKDEFDLYDHRRSVATLDLKKSN